LQDPISKKLITKKGWWSGSDIGPEFKSQYWKKTTKDISICKGMQEKKAQIIRSKDYKQKLNIIYELNLKISLKQMFLRKSYWNWS
jgi:hypothetical protein